MEEQNGNLNKVFVTSRFGFEAKIQPLVFFSVGAYRN